MTDLIVISAPDDVAGEAQVINHLFRAGLTRLHLRKPGWDADQLSKLLMSIETEYYPGIALHQHHQLADTFGIKRLHYTEPHRLATPVQTLKAQHQAGYVLSTSVHSLTQINDFGLFSYVFFGPVFNSISKPGYHSTLPTGFSLNKKVPDAKIIALGGVHQHNLKIIQQMNFDGAAVLGTIWSDLQQAVVRYKGLQQQLLQHQE